MAHSFTGDNLIHTDGHIVNMTMADYQNLQSQISRQEEALAKYGNHLPLCTVYLKPSPGCSCGWGDTLLQIREARTGYEKS